MTLNHFFSELFHLINVSSNVPLLYIITSAHMRMAFNKTLALSLIFLCL